VNDIHGNDVAVGDSIYIVDAVARGSKSKRLLYGAVVEISKGKCKVLVHENKRTYSKTSYTIIRPME